MKILENGKNFLIKEDNGILEFWSYTTKIASFRKGNKKKESILKLNREKWDFSQTTLKQLKNFINKYVEDGYYVNHQDFEKRIHRNGNIFLVKEIYL